MSEEELWPFVDADRHGWPAPEDAVSDSARLLYEAKLAARSKRTDQEIARAAAEGAADRALEFEYFKGVLEVAKGSIDRARASAELVQKAAGAIGVIYAAVLGVAFSVAERPLPVRGVLPAIFLGISIVCSTYFLAWLPRPEGESDDATTDESPPGTPLRDRFAVLFIRWNRRAALDRRRWLRAGVVSLAAAIALLPAAFVPLGERPQPQAARLPHPSNAAPGQPLELRAILYQTQVAQASATRTQPLTGEKDWIWWAGAGVLPRTRAGTALASTPPGRSRTSTRAPIARRPGGEANDVIVEASAASPALRRPPKRPRER